MKFLDTKQAARYLGLKPTTLEQWRSRTKIEKQQIGPVHRKHGRLVVYAEADLIAYSDNQIQQATA